MDRPPEFADIPAEYRTKTRAQLEADASGITSPAGIPDPRSAGRARAEILSRDREYAEEQERSRREFERKMSAAADARENSRQVFDAELSHRQMDHASKLAKEQLDTAHAAARAAKWAACAAGVAALGATGQLVVAIVGSLLAPS
jgi:hypothetical protein